MMHRRTFVAGGIAILAAPSAEAKVPLSELSRYFNGITTLKASFTQTTSGGARSTGTLYMRRPGRARFEYDPPDETLVVVGGSQVAIFDGRSNRATPEQYPLKRTPLSIVLERNVDLNRRNMVVGHRGDATSTVLTVQDPDDPSYGRAELFFQNDPLSLAGWTTVDAQGNRTRVELGRITLGGQLSSRLFNISAEIASRR